ncbi:hypothetical protein GYB29_01860 [bacterium]|nr:hypothetical protein [bacterium]
MELIEKQIISSTHLDLQAEKVDLHLLEEFAEVINEMGRFPMSQQHDSTKPFTGYMENAFIKEDSDNLGEYFLKADIYCDDKDLKIEFGGFSYSINIGMKSNTESPLFGVYLPYPFYNSDEHLERVLEIDEPVKVGKWLKKSADPATVALITAFTILILEPLWKQIYDAKFAPHIEKLLKSDKIDSSVKRDLVLQARDNSGNDFSVYFNTSKKKLRSLDPYIIKAGVNVVYEFYSNDSKAQQIGLAQVRLIYSESLRNYSISSLTYKNGEYLNF